jgi:phage portal protein BeeE
VFVRLFRRRPVEIVAPGRRAFPVDAQLAALQAARNSSGPISVDQLPIVQGLVQLHADIIAQFPLYAADRATGRRVVNTPTILDQPDPSEDAGDTKHAIVQSLWFTGNAYGLFTGEAMRVQNPSRVTLAPTLDPYDDRRVDGWHVAGVFIPAKFVAHFKINDDPRTGPLGRSPLAHCWQAVENYAWAYRYLADYFRAGGNPSIILKSRTAQDPTQADELWTNWVLARQAGRPAVVPYDVDVAAAPVAGDIGDVVHVLDFAAAEICRAVNVPPSLGNALVSSSLTYSTTLDELRRWLALSLGPTWLARIERGFTALIDPRLRARFDVSELPRLDVFGTQPASADVTTNPVPPQLKVVA